MAHTKSSRRAVERPKRQRHPRTSSTSWGLQFVTTTSRSGRAASVRAPSAGDPETHRDRRLDHIGDYAYAKDAAASYELAGDDGKAEPGGRWARRLRTTL